MFSFLFPIHTTTHTQTHIYLHISTYIYVYTHTHIYIYIYIYISLHSFEMFHFKDTHPCLLLHSFHFPRHTHTTETTAGSNTQHRTAQRSTELCAIHPCCLLHVYTSSSSSSLLTIYLTHPSETSKPLPGPPSPIALLELPPLPPPSPPPAATPIAIAMLYFTSFSLSPSLPPSLPSLPP